MLYFHLAMLAFVGTLFSAFDWMTRDADLGTWASAPPMTNARAAHAIASNGSSVWVIGGTGAGGAPVLSIERFDGRQWTDEGSLPGAGLNAPAAVMLDDRVYVIGGFRTDTNVPTDAVLVYDPQSKSWSNAAPLPAPRGGHAAVVLDRRIHVLGGGNSRSTIDDHDAYDPATDKWMSLPPLPRSEGSPAVVVHDGRIHAIGGRSGPSDFGDVYVYDPASKRWSSGPSIAPRGTAGAVVYCGSIHVFGGESQRTRSSLGDVLRFERTRWTAMTPMPTPRNFARAAVLGDSVYVIGGSPTPGMSHSSIGSATVERYSERCAR